jgi:A/G-specific adenine glycosylase
MTIHPLIHPLINWYQIYKRDLPWRNTNDPYKIWLSEIILQQTRVDQGMEYYIKFIQLFPTIYSLASAPEDLVMRSWQGLGYYSRARNLQFAAKQVVNQFGGVFPNNYNDILLLKGVGTYTAAAISSFAFGEAQAVVDGNVFRFLSRYFGIKTPIDSTTGKKEFQQLANDLLDKKRPGVCNQAMMEFGAIVCKPAAPLCDSCIFSLSCFAYRNNEVKQLPVKEKRIKVSIRDLHYLLVFDENANILIQKRGKNDIWESLYEFVLLHDNLKKRETSVGIDIFNFLQKQEFEPIKHILTHQHIHARFTIGQVKKFPQEALSLWEQEKWSNIDTKGFPRLFSRFLERPTVQRFIKSALISN